MDMLLFLLASSLTGIAVGCSAYVVLSLLRLAPRKGNSHSASTGISGDPVGTDEPSTELLIDFFAEIGRALTSAEQLQRLAESYLRAGEPGRCNSRQLLALVAMVSFTLSALLMLLIAVFPGLGGLWWALGLVILPFGPRALQYHFEGVGRNRLVNIRRSMPFALDIFTLVTRAGSSVPMALRWAATELDSSPGSALAEEFKKVIVDIDMGVPRRAAFEHMLLRVPDEDMQSFVETVLLAEELGRPIADSLEDLSDRFRINRMQRAEESAGSAGTYVAMPTMLIFVAVLILLFSPFIVKWLVGEHQMF